MEEQIIQGPHSTIPEVLPYLLPVLSFNQIDECPEVQY